MDGLKEIELSTRTWTAIALRLSSSFGMICRLHSGGYPGRVGGVCGLYGCLVSAPVCCYLS